MGLLDRAQKLAEMHAGARRSANFPQTAEELFDIIGYEPRTIQEEMDEKKLRFNCNLVHRRGGKTLYEIAKLTVHSAFCPFPNGRYAYTAPTYSMAKDIAWMYLTDFHSRLIRHLGDDPKKFQNISELSVTMPTASGGTSRIKLYGLDNPKERLRGLYLDGIVLDEWAQVPPSVWSEQIRPMLTDIGRQGHDEHGRINQWADFIFTPKGRNHAYTTYQNARAWSLGEAVEQRDEESGDAEWVKRRDWSCSLYKASDTGLVTEDELRDAKADMGHNKFMQEFECSFDAAIEGAIFAEALEKITKQGQVTLVPYNPHLPVNTAWDLGWSDDTAIFFFQHVGKGIAIIDYYETNKTSLPMLAEILADKEYLYGYHLFPHDVEVTDLGSGKDRASILRGLGVRVSTVQRVKVKQDAVHAANALIARCYFDSSKTSKALDHLSLYSRSYDERTETMSDSAKRSPHNHCADALMTLACGIRQYGMNGRVGSHDFGPMAEL